MEKKLTRNVQEKTVAGVCAGLAEYFEVDVTWVRIAFVLAVLAGFSGVLAYIVLWIAVPAKRYTDYGHFTTDYRVYDSSQPAPQPVFNEVPFQQRERSQIGLYVGIAFVVFGAFFLLDEFHFIPYWFEFHKLWPLLFIIPGILMLRGSKRKSWDDEWTEQQASPRNTQAAEEEASGAPNDDRTTGTN